jgi:hypothetical protein
MADPSCSGSGIVTRYDVAFTTGTGSALVWVAPTPRQAFTLLVFFVLRSFFSSFVLSFPDSAG